MPTAHRRLGYLAAAVVAIGCLALMVAIGSRSRVGHDETGPTVGRPKPELLRLDTAAAAAPGESGFAATGKDLFASYCAQCHGETGDGKGPAAVFLYPKPRDFRRGQFRLVTTTNGIAAQDDLERVIAAGMPGSAMFPFAHLPEAARKELAVYVRELTRAGAADRLRQASLEAGEEPDPKELAAEVDRLTTPGALVVLPKDLPAVTAESLTRGKRVYMAACASCHGETGKGDGAQDQRDDDGTPTRPRDFTLGIFKGGRDSYQLYARIAFGMPGTPMPASLQVLKPAEIGDLINFVQSLSDPAIAKRVEHRRTQLVAAKINGALDDENSAKQWTRSPGTLIVASPLWWRPHTPPDLTVQIVHNGQELAIRMTWLDATRNDHPYRPEDFEDMVAIQLFNGQHEPFLGMGAPSAASDLWMWRASWQANAMDADAILDDYPFESAAYAKLTKSRSSGKAPDFLTARAAGNLNADRGRHFSATNLAAEGFGTLTFRPNVSQLVRGRGTWNDGRWTVVLCRPLTVSAADGQSYAPGEQVSIAFALWDGEARDRDGQKLISIWHDLRLE
jgi:mono/diheme cytochrome c family protein